MNDTFLNINIFDADATTEKAITQEIADILDTDTICVTEGFSTRYDKETACHLAALSAKYPGVIIEVNGDGTQRDDTWTERHQNGNSERTSRYKEPVFDAILTAEEKKAAFAKAREAY